MVTCIFHYRLLRIPLLLLWACLASVSTTAQHYHPFNFSTVDGLPSSEVYQTFQDSKGYLWILTDNGLARFDGYEMETFTRQNGLPDNRVFRVAEDRQGRIYFLTGRNFLCRYTNGGMEPFAPQVNLDSILLEKIPSRIFINGEGEIHLAASKGESVFLDSSGTFLRATAIKDADLCFYKEDGFLKGTRFNRRLENPQPKPVPQPAFTKVTLPLADTSFFIPNLGLGYPWYCGDGEALFAFAYTDEVHLFTQQHGYQQLPLNKRVNHLFWDGGPHLWISTREGLLRYNLESEQMEGIPLPSRLISFVDRDREGGFWISTLDQGVFYIRSMDFQETQLGEDLVSKDVRLVEGFDDYLVAASQGPEFFLLQHGKVLQKFTLSELSKLGDRIRYILPLPERRSFLIAPQLSPLLELKVEEQSISEYLPGRNFLARGLGKANAGGVWAVKNGLFKLEGDSARLVMASKETYRDLFEDSRGLIWISNEDGLFHFDGRGLANIGKSDPLLAGLITAIEEPVPGTILLASQSEGLIGFKDSRSFRIPQLTPITGSAVNDIFVEAPHLIWLATNKGVFRLEKGQERWKARNFNTRHGLLSDEVHRVYVEEGRVWAATSKGLATFQAQGIAPTTETPSMRLESMKVNGKPQPLHPGEIHTFAHHENTIELDFLTHSFSQMGQLRYRYQLHGLDSSVVTTPLTRAQYNRLPPGQYHFTLQSSLPSGGWSDAETLVRFDIASPLWERWWFIAAALVLLLLLLILFLRQRIRSIRRREQVQTRIIELEKKALQAQMNPHFLFNSLNAVQGFLSGNETDKAEEYLADFSRLIRLILENSRSSMVALAQELELLEKYMAFESLRFDGRIQLDVAVASKIDQHRLRVPPMIIQPFVENAVVHGLANKDGEGRVRISLELQGEHVFCTIEDNGVGRENAARAAHKGPGQRSAGMVITRERLQLLNQKLPLDLSLNVIDLYDSAQQPVGTRVEALIPYHLSPEP